MRYPGFIAGAYTNQSLVEQGERLVNLYPERYEQSGSAPNQEGLFFTAVPGYSTFATLPTSPVQHMTVAHNGTLFVIAGDVLYEVASDGAAASCGSLAVSGGGTYYRTADNGVALGIVNGGSFWQYSYQNRLLTSATLEDPCDIAFIDGYFIALKRDSRQFQISGLLDGSTWDALDFAVAEGAGDNIVAIIADHRELWCFGATRTEVYYNSGSSDFPFERLPGGFIEHGCIAPRSIVKLDNSLVWLGGDARGAGMCWRANGYTPQRISNHAVEWIWSQYDSLDDAVAFAYQETGHQFYVLHFPSARPTRIMADGHPSVGYAGATWVFDAATGLWHERSYWDQVKGVECAHRGRFHAFAFGKHLLGDYQSGALYEQDADVHDFAGEPRRWLRSAPYLTNENRRTFYSRFELLYLAGQGTATGQGAAPVARLSWSNDAGATWSNELDASMGAIGATGQRCFWNRLGSGRRRCFAVAGSDPVRTVLIDAFIEAAAGTA